MLHKETLNHEIVEQEEAEQVLQAGEAQFRRLGPSVAMERWRPLRLSPATSSQYV